MDLRIEFQRQDAQFSPGEQVAGQIVLSSSKPIKAKYLKICIHGEAQTCWSINERMEISGKQGREHIRDNVRYGANIKYLDGESIAWSCSNGSNKLPMGQNIFPFIFQLPTNCPPSFKGCHGKIGYKIHVKLDRPWNFDVKTERSFQIVPYIDFQKAPHLMVPSSNSASKIVGLFGRRGQIQAVVTLPRSGYQPGESIPIHVEVDNQCGKKVETVKISLIQHSRFFGKRGRIHEYDACSSSHQHHNPNEQKVECQEVAKMKMELNALPYHLTPADLTLPLPHLAPTFVSPIMTVHYTLSVKVHSGLLGLTIFNIDLPITIGRQVPYATVTQVVPPTVPAMSAVVPSAPPINEPSSSGDAPPAYDEIFNNNNVMTSQQPPSFYSKFEAPPLPEKF